MPADQIQRTVERLTRIILLHALHLAAEHLGAFLADAVVDAAVTERVVHRAIQFMAREVGPQLPVAIFVAGVFPDFAQQQIIFICFDAVVDVLDEGIRQLVGHIQTKARCAKRKPMIQYAILPADELVIRRIGFLHIRKIRNAPPAFVAWGLIAEAVPAAIRRIFMQVRTIAIVSIFIKIDAVGAGVAEDAVQDNADAVLLTLGSERNKISLVAQHRIDLHVVRGIVAVV